MSVAGSRVGIVGGSIAGCAAAIALRRAGCDVEVYERSRGELRDRGAGVWIPLAVLDELVRRGYVGAEMPVCRPLGRIWRVSADGEPEGRVAWRQVAGAPTAAANNWGVLWRALRERVPDCAYHEGTVVASVRDGELQLADGESARFDAVLGADGYRSAVRGLLAPGATARYAGYVLWRGTYEESRVNDRARIDRHLGRHGIVSCFAGGHGVFYAIPGLEGGRRLNWAVYCAAPPGADFNDPLSIPPGVVDPAWAADFDARLDDRLPPYWASLVRLTEPGELSLQPVYDLVADRYAAGRVAVAGDAGTVARPNSGSGATKALEDALCLERACLEHDDWDAVLGAYGAERTLAGNRVVELGVRLGDAQVTHTPDWRSMSPEDFESFTAATLAGERLYLYPTAR